MAGEWILAEMEPCNLPQKVATGFTEAFSNLDGGGYIPVLYCGHQLVNGTNHLLICKQTLVVPGAPESLVKVIINEPLPTASEEAWTIVLIDRI